MRRKTLSLIALLTLTLGLLAAACGPDTGSVPAVIIPQKYTCAISVSLFGVGVLQVVAGGPLGWVSGTVTVVVSAVSLAGAADACEDQFRFRVTCAQYQLLPQGNGLFYFSPPCHFAGGGFGGGGGGSW